MEYFIEYTINKDVKPGNILFSSKGMLKLTDFGLAKKFEPHKANTKNVCTKFYRAPELLFGAQLYGPEIDIWSLGCIFAELYLRKFVFPGDGEIDMLSKIFTLRGTPTDITWPSVKDLPYYFEFSPMQPIPLCKHFPEMTDLGRDLLDKMISLDPTKRIMAADALTHPYFKESPVECESDTFIKEVLA
jgi:serine/threonine protein kinase